MIRLSNGHEFEYMVASGALGYDGKGWPHEWPLRWMKLINPSLFTVVIKTLTYEERKGNFKLWCPWQCIRILPEGGVVNAVGLTNPGIGWWCRKIGPKVNRNKIALVGSILSDNITKLIEMAKMLSYFDLVGLEINWSCPNIGANLLDNTAKIIAGCEEVKKVTNFPLIAKLSVAHDVEQIIPRLEGIVEAISINSVLWKTVFPSHTSPFAHLDGGGVSGGVAQKYTWRLVRKLTEITSIPVIGPSIWRYGDMQKVRDHGAKAVSFGSIFLPRPWDPTRFVKRDMNRNRN